MPRLAGRRSIALAAGAVLSVLLSACSAPGAGRAAVDRASVPTATTATTYAPARGSRAAPPRGVGASAVIPGVENDPTLNGVAD